MGCMDAYLQKKMPSVYWVNNSSLWRQRIQTNCRNHPPISVHFKGVILGFVSSQALTLKQPHAVKMKDCGEIEHAFLFSTFSSTHTLVHQNSSFKC